MGGSLLSLNGGLFSLTLPALAVGRVSSWGAAQVAEICGTPLAVSSELFPCPSVANTRVQLALERGAGSAGP